MGIWEIIVGALVLIFSVIMIIVIILQEGHDSGLGTITGGADSFLKRGKAKTADALFARVTKYCAIVFFVLVVLLNALSYFGLSGRSDGNNVVNETSNEVSVVSEISEDENSTAGETTESSVESKAETSNTEESAVAESSAESVAESSAERQKALLKVRQKALLKVRQRVLPRVRQRVLPRVPQRLNVCIKNNETRHLQCSFHWRCFIFRKVK